MSEPQEPNVPRLLEVNDVIYKVLHYAVRPAPDEDGVLLVDVTAYSEERDETITVNLGMPVDENDPTQPLWPEPDAQS